MLVNVLNAACTLVTEEELATTVTRTTLEGVRRVLEPLSTWTNTLEGETPRAVANTERTAPTFTSAGAMLFSVKSVCTYDEPAGG